MTDANNENEVFCEKVISELDKVISDPQSLVLVLRDFLKKNLN